MCVFANVCVCVCIHLPSLLLPPSYKPSAEPLMEDKPVRATRHAVPATHQGHTHTHWRTLTHTHWRQTEQHAHTHIHKKRKITHRNPPKYRTHTLWWILKRTTNTSTIGNTHKRVCYTQPHTHPSRVHRHSNSLQTANLFSDAATVSQCERCIHNSTFVCLSVVWKLTGKHNAQRRQQTFSAASQTSYGGAAFFGPKYSQEKHR